MIKWVKLPLDIKEENLITAISLNAKNLCIVKEGNEIYAFQNRCPHAGGNLSYGKYTDGKIICPIHRWSYDVKTGFGSEGQGDYIHIYPIKIQGNEVYIGFKTSLWERILKGKNSNPED